MFPASFRPRLNWSSVEPDLAAFRGAAVQSVQNRHHNQGLLRRHEWLRSGPNESAAHAVEKDVFDFGDKSVHFEMLELRVRDHVFPLTLMEANLLRYLIQHEGKPVARKDMLEEVWGLHEDTDTRAIDNFIVRLRRYIEDDPTHPQHLLTVRGVGYRFVAAPSAPR